MESPARYIGVMAGRQSGKTFLGAFWFLREIQKAYSEGKSGDFLIAAPTLDIVNAGTLKNFRDFLPEDWGEYKVARKEYILFGGRIRIFVRTTDNPDHLEGMTLLGAWLDEAGQMKEAVWTKIQARLAVHRGKCIMTSTPYATNWYYREVWKKQILGEVECFTWASSENPTFPKEDFEKYKKELPDHIFKREYCGEFTQPADLVYSDFDEDKHVVEPFDIPDNWRKFAGLDFGFSVPTAVVCIAEDPENKIYYVYKEFYEKEVSLARLSSFLEKEDLEYVFADTQGAQQINELQKYYGNRNVRGADKSPGSVELGIERVSKLLRENRLKFFARRVPNTLAEIEVYHRKKDDPDKNSGKDGPVKKKDHAMDALRYAFHKEVQNLYPQRVLAKRSLKEKLAARNERLSRSLDPYTNY